MCEFCNGKAKPIIQSVKMNRDKIETIGVQIVNGNTLKIIGTLQSSYFVGLIPLETETEIFYCPMCGRELSEV